MTRRIFRAGSAVAITAFLAVGCGDGSGGLPDPQFLLRGATAASAAVTSAHVQMNSEGRLSGLDARELSADVRARGKAGPGASVGTAKVTGATLAFVEQEGRFYTRGPDGRYSAAQLPAGAALPRPSELLDPERGLAKLLGGLREVRTEAREEREGVLAFRVVGTVPRADAAAWLPGSTGDPTLTVWFAAQGRHLPVGTRLSTVNDTGQPVTIDFALSELNEKVQIPAVD
ncbi:LppX_LprAFG lipoprotein [Nocardia sp. NPDC050697]|uniref:LppX_LprAFG lipoprotein n=1 Tax=Nocardia sp. NPDC050697 TaxID=3155158 RepID=UPI003410D238